MPETTIDLAALDALLTPVEMRAKAIEDGLEKYAEARQQAQARIQKLYVTPDGDPLPQDWAGIRLHPEVAPLLAHGWKLAGVEHDFALRRVACLVREKPE